MKPPRRPGTGMIIAGAITMGVSIIGGIIALIISFTSMTGGFMDYAETSHEISGPTMVDSLGDQEWYLLPLDDDVSATCTVLDSAGVEVTTGTNVMWQTFVSEADETYTVECDVYPVMLGGEIPMGGILGLGLIVLIAPIVFIVGLILLIIGLVRRSRANRHQPPPNYYYQPGPPQGYGQPGPYQAPGDYPSGPYPPQS